MHVYASRLSLAAEAIVSVGVSLVCTLGVAPLTWLGFISVSRAANTGETDPEFRIRAWREFCSALRDLVGEISESRRTNAVGLGTLVRIRSSFRSPLPGSRGVVIEVSMVDPCGPYLVEFANGFRFRYRANELRRIVDRAINVD